MQDFTGVPAIVDLAAMRDAMDELGGDPARINPLQPAELVIDHSIQVDSFAERLAFQRNAELEYERNGERYAFLRWGQSAFDNFAVVPPNTGICHQVNLEYLARVVIDARRPGVPGHAGRAPTRTPRWSTASACSAGASAGSRPRPRCSASRSRCSCRRWWASGLTGELPEGSTATDLVLTVTQMLRERGVVGKFVEFFGPGLATLPLADRATIGNMAPEYGATCGIFPVDAETLRYLEFSGRPAEQVALVEAYCREQGLFHDEHSEDATYSDTLELDLADVEPSLAGPRRPQDRVALSDAAQDFREELAELLADGETQFDAADEASAESFPASDPPSPAGTGLPSAPGHQHSGAAVVERERSAGLDHGAVVIAAITSCTNTSNPSVMIGAGLLAKKAVEAGLRAQAVGQDLARAGVEGGHRLPRARRPARAAVAARLRPRRLRLHHLHRELRSAARGDLERDRGARPGRLLRALRQPQLRGPHPPRGQDELPGLAAALRGLRAGRPDGRGHHRASRSRATCA